MFYLSNCLLATQSTRSKCARFKETENEKEDEQKRNNFINNKDRDMEKKQ